MGNVTPAPPEPKPSWFAQHKKLVVLTAVIVLPLLLLAFCTALFNAGDPVAAPSASPAAQQTAEPTSTEPVEETTEPPAAEPSTEETTEPQAAEPSTEEPK